MADNSTERKTELIHVRYRGRGSQTAIYFGKMLRTFVYQNDWKLLPMAAVVAGLVGLVARTRMFLNMEGTLMGAFAFTCVCIWNGAFNSIQTICRERDVIKREHRSGMHISSYIISHMMYQAFLCLLQIIITLYVTRLVGVQYPEQGLITKWFFVDIGVSMFLITYASDMLSLWISALSRSSTTAMTIMPFVLIFQLVFSGSLISLPEWAEPMSNYTISAPGLNVIAAQSNVNEQPFVTISDMLEKMRNQEIEETVTIRQILDVLKKADNAELREIIEQAETAPELEPYLEESRTFKATIGEILDTIGEEKTKTYLEQNAAAASSNAKYDRTEENIKEYWGRLILFIFGFALLALITLEFIDKDKR